MFLGGETGENVRKAAAWLFPDDKASQQARKRRASETADGAGGPAFGTRSRKGKKQAANPLADLWNSATGATNNAQAADAGGADAVSDFLGKIVGGGDTLEQLKGVLGGGANGGNLQDVLGALAGAVGGQNNNGGRR